MPFVLDASIVHDWAFDELHPTANTVRERLHVESAVAPSLWWFEVRNGLVMAERRGQVAEQQTANFLREILRLSITLDRSPNEVSVLDLARRHRLTVYDAAYLELAIREGLPLATLDTALMRAARAESVPVIGEAEG
ncbi:MAG: type II toxin-antitoxin system VapC family toxin [Stellaceae bacterium]